MCVCVCVYIYVVLEKTLESPLDCKEIQPVHSEGDQPWDFLGRTDAKAETPILCQSHAKTWLTGKDSDAGRDWGQEKGTTGDEMAGSHHWLNGHEFEWTPGVGIRQGGLECCDSWGRKESDTTELLNWSYMYDSETMCISLEKKVGFWLRKKMHSIYFINISTPKLCYWKLIDFLVFCSCDLKIINDFMFFRLILVNASCNYLVCFIAC